MEKKPEKMEDMPEFREATKDLSGKDIVKLDRLLKASAIPSISPIELAEKLLGMYTHAELANTQDPEMIVYPFDKLIPFLKSLGLPDPDFAGYARKVSPELLSGPWDTVVESMQAKNMDYDDLAEILGTTGEALELCVANNTPITLEIAQGLEKAFGVEVTFWVNRENLYREKLAEIDKIN